MKHTISSTYLIERPYLKRGELINRIIVRLINRYGEPSVRRHANLISKIITTL